MKRAKILLFNFILIPQLLLASSLKTGDANSKATTQINTDGENVVIQNNDATAVSNTGNKTDSGSQTTGDATAVSEVNINNGKVEGKLEVEANGEKKVLKVDKPGSYRLEIDKDGNVVVTASSAKQMQTKSGVAYYLKKFLNFLFSFFKR